MQDQTSTNLNLSPPKIAPLVADPTNAAKDLEKYDDGEAHLANNTVSSLAWKNTSVERVWFSSDLKPKQLITDVDGIAMAGKYLQFD